MGNINNVFLPRISSHWKNTHYLFFSHFLASWIHYANNVCQFPTMTLLFATLGYTIEDKKEDEEEGETG
jgi:hypothetical protein